MQWRKTTLMLASLAAGTVGVVAAAQEYEISRSTIDGGGVMRSSGGDFELSSTIGQPDAGVMSSGDGTFELTGGFWFALAPGDCDEDGAVGLFDHQAFEACLTGPGQPTLAGCECYDVDRNGTVDLADFASNQTEFSQ